MKQLFTVFTFFIFRLLTISQEEFSFTLYFEDAVGNKDSLILGYDENATDGIDESLGEENIIHQPWSDKLDVRIGDKTYSNTSSGQVDDLIWLTENTYLTKKQIIEAYCEESLASSRVSIQFYTPNLPITIRWDKEIIKGDSCSEHSFFFGREDHFSFNLYHLQYEDSLQVDSTLINDFFASYSWEGKEIGVLQFIFHKETTLNNDEFEEKNKVLAYPNPIASNELLNVEFIGNYSIINHQGQVLKNGEVENNRISLYDVPQGVYFLILQNTTTINKLKIIKL